jgi:hypothetical protein
LPRRHCEASIYRKMHGLMGMVYACINREGTYIYTCMHGLHCPLPPRPRASTYTSKKILSPSTSALSRRRWWRGEIERVNTSVSPRVKFMHLDSKAMARGVTTAYVACCRAALFYVVSHHSYEGVPRCCSGPDLPLLSPSSDSL